MNYLKSCSINVKKVSLELGGKSALLIFDDCELDRAVKQVNPLINLSLTNNIYNK